MEREDVSLVKMKCHPGGMSLIPQNCTEVVKERRSMPPSMPGGSSSRSAAAFECRGVGTVISNSHLKVDAY